MTPFLSPERKQIVSKVLVCIALAVATVVVYLPVRHHEFVNFDDDRFVTENPKLREGLNWRSIRWAFTSDLTRDDQNADYWRPLSYLSHALDVQMFGLRPAGHHLVSLGIHVAAVVALFLVLQSMTGALWRSALVAALFALHPLRVESVAWVAERKDVLSGLFFILTLGAYARYARRPFSVYGYLVTLFTFVLALMSKSMAVTLPFVLLLLDYWPLGRTQWAKPATGRSVGVSPAQLLKEKVPFFVLAVASCAVTFWALRREESVERISMPLGMRISNVLLSYMGHVGKTFWPTSLAVWYPSHAALSAIAVVGAGVGVVGMTTAVMWRMRHKPWLAVGWFWFFGTLAPVIGLGQLGEPTMADRFTYIPSIGLFLMLSWSVPGRAIGGLILNAITCVIAGTLLVVCAALSKIQVGYWRDSETLFRHALNVTRDNWLMHDSLGLILVNQGRPLEAIEQFVQALQIKPDFAEAHNDLANALLDLGKVAEAIAECTEALRIRPDYAETHNNLGYALASQGKVAEAIAQYWEALRLEPDLAPSLYGLVWILATDRNTSLRNGTEAVQLGERLCAITGFHDAEDLDALAAAYAEAGRFSDAIRIAQKAIELANVAGQQELAKQIQERLKLYQAGRPFHEGSASVATVE